MYIMTTTIAEQYHIFVNNFLDFVVGQGLDAQGQGNILLFDFKKPRQGAYALDIVGDLDRSTFSPLGLSIWRHYNSSKASCKIVHFL